MKQQLQLKIGQRLTMTPQLQQAIRLLQLSTVELQQEIQQALDNNLMLEAQSNQDEPDTETTETENTAESPPENDTIPDELPVDADWSSIYDNLGSAGNLSPATDFSPEQNAVSSGNLRDYLHEQVYYNRFNDLELRIAQAIIENIDDNGFLVTTTDEIALSFDGLDGSDVEGVLFRIQQFDPVGVGARDLQESLLIQLRHLDDSTPSKTKALLMIEQYYPAFIDRNMLILKLRLGLDDNQLYQIQDLIRNCNPHPGASFTPKQNDYVVPDVIVKSKDNHWSVELNSETIPKIRLNHYYVSLIKRSSTKEDNQMMLEHLKEARWLMKSLDSRFNTLLRVAKSIVKHQLHFFEQGPKAMKPLVMRELADELELHESTISRASTNKYMLTPRGMFEFKYFFSNQLEGENGTSHSSTAIRALIKQLINEEIPEKPLSDNRICSLLNDSGISIARRTIAKYRESMSIPSSSERKRMI